MANKAVPADHLLTTPRSLTLGEWFWYFDEIGLCRFDPDRFETFLCAAGYRDGRPGIPPTLPDWAVEESAEQHEKWRKRGIRSEHTYFALAKYSGRIKIGMTSHWPETRVRQLQHDKPYGEDSVLLCSLRGSHFESMYHKIFHTWCVGGEWFAPHPDILAEIERLKGCAQ